MAFQFTPIAFGVMLMVAVGTLAYTVWNMNSTRQQRQSYGGSTTTSFDPGYDTVWDDDDAERRRRKRVATKDLCSICLDTMKNNTKTLPCKHVFHDRCITVWFQSNNTCPICRSSSSSTL